MIYTVTLNPAVDKILFLDEFQKCRTNRLNRTVETLGGKGTHVSINLKLLEVHSTALGITLGANGKKITSMLESWGVDVQFLHYEIPGMESRTNYEIVETNGSICSMLTERGPILPKQITDDLIAQIKRLLKKDDSIVLTGDASNIDDKGIYSKLTRIAKEIGAKVFLDASGPYLKEGLDSSPYLIKPNFEELCFIANRELDSEEEILSVLDGLDVYNIPLIVMTWSGKGAISQRWRGLLPGPAVASECQKRSGLRRRLFIRNRCRYRK